MRILCYVTDRRGLANGGTLPTDLFGVVARAIRAGVDWVQIREKDLPARELLALAQSAGAENRGFGPPEQDKSKNNMRIVSGRFGTTRASIIVNDRLDVALAAGVAGVHLGGESLPVAAVNAAREGGILPKEFLIGASCHSLDAARAAERDGADYIFFGPVFATPSKEKSGASQGIGKLAEVSRNLKIPVLAIGGVNEENAADCFAAGAAGIAAIRMFQDAVDLPALVARLRNRM
ncbi:MAG TPA: thiamine phosphate synthase [Candidatus Acidoferrum sp.]|nr:thiamine phosphate synthase [Candidatus Acidoferrum sp.]